MTEQRIHLRDQQAVVLRIVTACAAALIQPVQNRRKLNVEDALHVVQDLQRLMLVPDNSPVFFKPAVVTDGYVVNLLDIPELHLYDEYWDAVVNTEMTVDGSLYTASGPLNFMALDLAGALLFNQDMMDDHKTMPLKRSPRCAPPPTERSTSTTETSRPPPATCPSSQLSDAGLILDALTYESWRDVLPVYYDITVSQKGLRNAESIEMMQILRDSRSIDFTRVFPIATDLGEALRTLVSDGTGDVSGAASVIESNKSAVGAALHKVLDAMKKNQ